MSVDRLPRRTVAGLFGRALFAPALAQILILAVVLLAAACGQMGSSTTRIDAAEAEVDTLIAEVVEVLNVEVVDERPFGVRDRCEQPGLGPGLSNTRALRATMPEADDAVQRVSAVLTGAGYGIDRADRGEGVFARRDGIRIAVLFDPVRDRTEIDANTGCRAAPVG